MDTNNWRSTPPSGEPPMDPGDWRAQLQPDSRQRIVNKIMDTLKRHLPFSGQEGLNELRKIAVRFEEKIFADAANQTDYLRRISLKILTMENKSQNAIPNTGNNSKPPDPGSQGMQNQVHSRGQSVHISLQSNQSQALLLSQSIPNNMASAGVQSSAGLQSGMPTVSGLTQNPLPNVVGQNSNMQNMSGISQNSLGQGMPSNIFANQQRQMQGRQQVLPQQQQQQQHLYHQQLQNQLMKQQIQQGNLQPSLMQSHMQQQQNHLPATQLQSSQQSGMQTSSIIQQSSMQATPVPGLQHNQQSSLQQSTQSMLQQHQQAQQAASSGIHKQTPMAQQSTTPQQQQQPPQPQHQQPHLMGHQTNAASTQQNQLIGQRNSIAEMQQQRLLGQANNLPNLQQQQRQQLMAQKTNLSNIHQQQLGPQSNSSGLQQQQPQLIGAQSGNSTMQTNQQSLHMLSHPKVPLQQMQQSASNANLLPTQGQASQQSQQQQQLMSQMQSQSTLQQQLGLQQQPNQLQPNMQQRLQGGQVSSSLLQSQNLTDQQKQLYQSQRAVPETSSTSLDSTAQTELANGGDWQEEVYQKIQTLKETYLPELNEMYQKIATKLQQHDANPQQPKYEQLDSLKLFKTMLQHILAVLSVPKANITPPFKEKLSSYEKQIINFVNSNRPRKPVTMLQEGQFPPPHMHSMQQAQTQINQTQSHDNQMNPQLQSENLQGSVPAMQPNNITSMQHNSLSPVVSTTHQTKLNSLQPGSNMDSGQGNALGSMQQVVPGPLQQNPVSTSQQANFNSLSSQSGASVLPQNINSRQSSSNMLQHQQMKQQQEQQMLQSQKYKQQFQHRQMQHQYIQQKQQLLQQQQQLQQPQQQAKQQPSTQLQTHPMPQLHQMNDANDMRQGVGAKTGVFQHLQAGQRQSYAHQQLKSGAQFPVSSPQLLQAASPQMPQHSSPQVDQQNLLSSISKSGTPLQSANLPFVVPSPSTPLVPSPIPGESEKPVQGTSLPNVATIGNQQGTSVQAGSQSLAIGTPGISASPLLAEFTGADGIHANALTAVSSKSNITEQSLERLMKAVKSISPIALGAAVNDIGSVVSMTDRIAGSTPGNGSRAAVGEDLVAMTKCRLQARNFISQDGMSRTKKIRRHTSAVPLNVVSSAGSLNDSFKRPTGSTSDLESTATSSVKRPRIEANHGLLEEIREINERLIDTVVGISDEGVYPGAAASTTEGGEGTIVKCSFSAVALSSKLKSQYMSVQMLPIQPLHLLVPTNYPNCSPILLDKCPVGVSKEHEDLSVKAKSRFSISLRSLPQPMSLSDIARTWDVCARVVISDHSKLSGGGNFSSKYGTWENCLSAA
ncbi:Mediator of RNA polymerase II transcription subunit 15a [Hibiscus syriacus]|uniref:Mediator of RNA polymerase II transcription subunit 15a n=1 Tax=Hibiscus syriacus TaxID=106335 RepID=A0A6A2XWX9_HIBSY|nr:mediator of RNA polymerase II transcription subunit 15a-like [Hibiscus syriacus]KAE8662939.1 Mediator of RNA polymerase II transcription subunit 15a [Hibiscus syriacus]